MTEKYLEFMYNLELSCMTRAWKMGKEGVPEDEMLKLLGGYFVESIKEEIENTKL